MVIRSRENLLGAWAFLLGIILAIALGLFAEKAITPLTQAILAGLGILIGYFVAEKDVQTFLYASVSVVVVSVAWILGVAFSASIMGVGVGKILTSVMGTMLLLFVPATIMVALKTVFSISKS